MEEGEITCCRATIPFHVERGDDPPLCRAAGDKVYRITYEEAFGEHAWVRIGRRGDEISVYRAYHPKLFSKPERFEATLTTADWQQFQDALAAAKFWSLPAVVPSQGAWLDGYDVIVEGRQGNVFKAAKLLNPDVEELWRLGRVAFDLAGLAEVRI